MNSLNSNAEKMTNRESFRQQEEVAQLRIPGIRELLKATADQKYPDAVFALKITSNPFIKDREIGPIQMEAYTAILNGNPIADVRYKYDRQMDAYVKRHNWD